MTYRICEGAGERHITEAEHVCTHALSNDHPGCGAGVRAEPYETLEEARRALMVARYQDAVYQDQQAHKALERAKEVVSDTTLARRLAQYEAIISIACPYCEAGTIGESCRDANNVPRPNAPSTQHGMRQDLSGVNGEYSRQHAIKFLEREKAKR